MSRRNNNKNFKSQNSHRDGTSNRKEDRRNGGKKFKDSNISPKEGSMNRKSFTYKDTPFNDFSWYNNNPSLTVAVGKIPFPYRPGMSLPIIDATSNNRYTIPGVLTITYDPWVGGNEQPTDPINIVGREIFNKIRAAFSGSIDVDPPDLIMYFMALDSIFMRIGEMKRIFRIINAYSPDNYVTPDVLLRALGVTNADTWRTSKMEAFQYINTLVHMVDKFKCPAIFPLFNRHYWLVDNVFTDRNSLNAQLYTFVPDRTFLFSVSDENQESGVMAGNLTYLPIDRSTPQTMYQGVVTLINNLSAWDDAFVISGYLKRAFEGMLDFRMDEIAYNEVFTPKYDESVLAQIENAYTDALVTPWATFKGVYQNVSNNTVYTDFTLGSSYTLSGVLPHINSRNDVPDVIDTIENTRLQTYIVSSSDVPSGYEVITGSEFIRKFTLYTSTLNPITIYSFNNNVGASAETLELVIRNIAFLEQFDWHPIVISVTSSGSLVVGDVANFTTFGNNIMREINRVCLLSEFNAFGI